MCVDGVEYQHACLALPSPELVRRRRQSISRGPHASSGAQPIFQLFKIDTPLYECGLQEGDSAMKAPSSAQGTTAPKSAANRPPPRLPTQITAA